MFSRQNNKILLKRLYRAGIFFVIALLLLSFFRLWFVFEFKPSSQDLEEFGNAFLMGMRIDAQSLSILMMPAIALLCISWPFPKAFNWAIIFSFLGIFIFLFLNTVNFGFYSFFSTTINPLIFGILEDDTKAVLKILWNEWPVIKILMFLVFLTILPFVIAAYIPKAFNFSNSAVVSGTSLLIFLLVLTVLSRGGVGPLPLRASRISVFSDPFINISVLNGPVALYDAVRARKVSLELGDPKQLLSSVGLTNEEQLKKILKNSITSSTPEAGLKFQPNIVLAIMESMGSELFEADDEETNDMLGTLRQVLSSAIVFKNGVSAWNSTFQSLEAILFRTPVPLTQSKYGVKNFSFSELNDFKEAGYKVIFLTSGQAGWRNLDLNYPRQGFDAVLGASYLKSKYPEVIEHTWGVDDKWMFKAATELLEEAENSGEKLFLVLLSASNHLPYEFDSTEHFNPVNPAKLPNYISSIRLAEVDIPLMLKAYQSASNALGEFIQELQKDNLLSKTLVVATGDHNQQAIKYNAQGMWYRNFAVPIIFWIPEKEFKAHADTTRWVSHLDIFPTLKALALDKHDDPIFRESLFAANRKGGAVTFNNLRGGTEIVIDKAGAVELGHEDIVVCYSWFYIPGSPRLKLFLNRGHKCTVRQLEMARIALARRILSDFQIRKELFNLSPSK